MVASLVIVALPVVAAIVAWRGGWVPYGDQAAVVIQSWGTLSAHPPLLGNHSTIVPGSTANSIYHPGPLQLWLLAVPIRLIAPSPGGALIGTAVLTSLALSMVLVVFRRRGGWPWTGVAVVFLSVFIWAAGAETLRSPSQPDLASFALLACLAAGWAVLNRDHWFWPLVVFFASLSAQVNTMFLLPVATLALSIFATWGVLGLRDRRRGNPPCLTRRQARMIGIVTVAVGLLCWSGPLYDQFFGSGNLGAMISSGARIEPAGLGWTLHLLVAAFAVPPVWLAGNSVLHLSASSSADPSWFTSNVQYTTAALFAVAYISALVAVFRRRDRPLGSFGLVVSATILGNVIATNMMPDTPFGLFGHMQMWPVTGMAAWLFVAMVGCSYLARKVDVRPGQLGRLVSLGVPSCVLVVALVSAGGTLSGASPSHDAESVGYGAAQLFAAAALPGCADGPVEVVMKSPSQDLLTLGLVAMLQLDGCQVHVDRYFAQFVPGPWLGSTGEEPVTLTVLPSSRAPDGFRRMASFDPAHPPVRYREFTRALSKMQWNGPVYLYARDN